MKNKKECVIAKKCEEFLWQSQTRKGLLRHDVPRNDLCKKKECVIANVVKQSQTDCNHAMGSPRQANAFLVMTKKSAFTLAEVLITLGIIGIVAVLTIPNLQQQTNEKELVSSYLKAHSVLNNAYKEAEAVKGFKLFGLTVNQFKEYLEEHLKTVKCEEHDVCLTDGSYYDYECDENQCNYITVDTNGQKKPNQIGKDIYKFKVTPNGLISEGEKDICSGYDCGNYVLSHHKIFDGLLTGCEEYGNDGRCTQCQDGYKINNGLCSSVNMAGCKAYSGESCSSCNDGYKNNDGICEKLNLPNCIGYTGEKCSSCNNGYLLTGTSCTSMESLNCKSTEDGESCSVCNDKYTNNSGNCEEVEIANCKSDGYTGDKCSSCLSGYYAKDAGNCEAQPTYCTEMLNDGENCKLSNGVNAKLVGDKYVTNSDSKTYQNALSYCSSIGMQVPDINTLTSIYDYGGSCVWSSTPVGYDNYVYVRCSYGTFESPTEGFNDGNRITVCVGNVK